VPEQSFWQQRQQWPDDHPSHVPVTPEQIVTDWAPVVTGDRVGRARVVITPDQPLGIWHLNGVELAPVIDALREAPWEQVVGGLPPAQRGPVAGWLQSLGFGPDTAASGADLHLDQH